MKHWELAFFHASPHGVAAAVHLPDSPDPVPPEVLARLLPGERSHAATLRGYRQVEFVGGRLALRSACAQLGMTPPAVLPDDRGEPQLPSDLVGSITHKRDLAVAMVARPIDGTLGIDLENYGPERPGIASRILTEHELAQIAALPEERRWLAVLLRFSIKEAIYKGLHPYVRRYVGFHEAEVTPDLRGRADVVLRLAGNEGPFEVDARYEFLHQRVLSTVRIRPSQGADPEPAAAPPAIP